MTFSFFRRHRKFFLVLMLIGVVGLVGWQIWDYFARGATRIVGGISYHLGWSEAGETIARVGGEPVKRREVQRFFAYMRVGGRTSQTLYAALVFRQEDPAARARAIDLTLGQSAWHWIDRGQADGAVKIEDLMAWYGAWLDARERGFEPSDREIEDRLAGLAEVGMTRGVLEAVAQEAADGNFDALREGLKRDMTLAKYVHWLLGTAGTPVEQEVRQRFARMGEEVRIRMAILEAKDFLGQVEPPADQAIRKQYETYREYLLGEGPGGYGYRIPGKVVLECLVADPSAFMDQALAAVTDQEIVDYYNDRKEAEFVVKQPEEDGEGEGESEPEGGPGGDAPAAREEGGESDEAGEDEEGEEASREEPPGPVYRPLDEVRDEVRRKLAEKRAADLARLHLNAVVTEVRGHRDPPDLRIWADGTKVRYEALDRPRTADELRKIDGLGDAVHGRLDVADVATAVPELVGTDDARIPLKEISEVFVDGGSGRAYAFRVRDVVKDREPESVEEVRGQVVADLVVQAAYEAAVERARQLRAAASEKGLEAAAEEAGIETTVPRDFPREWYNPYYRQLGTPPTMAPVLPGVGSNEAFVREVFELDAEGRQRTLVELPEQRKAVVAELIERLAPRRAAYELLRPTLTGEVAGALQQEIARRVLDPARMRDLYRVEVLEDEREGGAEGGPDEPEATEG